MQNLEIRQLRDNIIALLNASNLPIEAKRLIVADIYSIVDKKANEVILEEAKPKVKAEKEEQKNV